MNPDSSFVNAMTVGGWNLWRGKALFSLHYMNTDSLYANAMAVGGC
jgi:hypothetical protein